MTRVAIIILLIGLSELGFGQDSFFSSSGSVHYHSVAEPSSEMGMFVGGSFYNGELNKSSQLNPDYTHMAYGLVFRRNLNARYALRFQGFYGNLSGSDLGKSDDLSLMRNASFTSSLYEASAAIEFNFFAFNPVEKSPLIVPYVYIGVGAFKFAPKSNSGNRLDKMSGENTSYSTIQPVMPFGGGVKIKAGYRVLASIEWSPRKTGTDFIDDVSTVYPTNGLQRGNSQNNDWYSLVGFILAFRLGETPNDCWH